MGFGGGAEGGSGTAVHTECTQCPESWCPSELFQWATPQVDRLIKSAPSGTRTPNPLIKSSQRMPRHSRSLADLPLVAPCRPFATPDYPPLPPPSPGHPGAFSTQDAHTHPPLRSTRTPPAARPGTPPPAAASGRSASARGRVHYRRSIIVASWRLYGGGMEDLSEPGAVMLVHRRLHATGVRGAQGWRTRAEPRTGGGWTVRTWTDVPAGVEAGDGEPTYVHAVVPRPPDGNEVTQLHP